MSEHRLRIGKKGTVPTLELMLADGEVIELGILTWYSQRNTQPPGRKPEIRTDLEIAWSVPGLGEAMGTAPADLQTICVNATQRGRRREREELREKIAKLFGG